jgi:hypothetical protein
MALAFARRWWRPSRRANARVRHSEPLLRPHARSNEPILLASAFAGLAVVATGRAYGAEHPRDFFPPTTPPFETIADPDPDARTAPPPDELRPAQLTLVFFDPSGALPSGVASMAAEVQSVFRELGVEASWRVGGSFGESPIPEIPVILLRRAPVRRPGQERVLGLVVRKQQPLRAVWLFADNVRAALDLDHDRWNPEVELQRALARVAAHEVVHAVAPDAPHAREGLMRHSLTKEFLIGPRAPIDSRCAASFVTRLAEEQRRFLIRSSGGTAPRSPVADPRAGLAR